jgi:hypothetical protein
VARQRTDLLSKLTDAGEDAISRLGDAPGADRLLAVATNMRDRVDELSKKVRGIDAMEQRLKELERKVDKLGGAKTTSSSRAGSAKSTTAKPRSTASKGSGTRKSSSSAKKS